MYMYKYIYTCIYIYRYLYTYISQQERELTRASFKARQTIKVREIRTDGVRKSK